MDIKKLKAIPGFPGYFISKRGRVFSIKSETLQEIKVSLNPATLRPQAHIEGHSKPIHRLVALAYIPNPENKPCVCHKDNNPENNHVDNLYWGTHKMNTQQCIRDGRLRPKGKVPKTPNEKAQIVKDYLSGMSNSQIKGKWGIGITRLNAICSEAGIIKKTGDIRKLQLNQVNELIKLYDQGYTREQLATQFGISRAGVGNYIRKYHTLRKYANNE